jgi:uroporphyrinogen decarboxylase
MTPRQRIMAALNLQEPDKVPFADWTDPGIRGELTRAMGYDSLDDAQFHTKMGMDAICYAEDDYMAPQFCKKIIDEQGAAHLLGEGLIKSEKDFEEIFVLTDPNKPGYFNKAKRYVDRFGNSDLAIFAGMRTGMMNTIFSMGLMEFSTALYGNVKLIETMLDRYIDWNIRVAEGLIEAGIDFLVCYDDIAFNSGPIFSPKVFREIFLPRMKRFADTLTIPWVYHSDGDVSIIFDDLLSMGMNGYNPFQPDVMDIFKYKREYGARLCLWGNIDLKYTLSAGTEDEVETEVREKIKDLALGGGYILATSNSITDFCKVENILAMIRAKEKYGSYPIQIR